MGIETELKLRLSPDDWRKVSRMPLLKKYARGRSSRKRLLSVYFDTPGLELVDHGMVFRIRKEGQQWTQTVKTAGTANGGLHERGEYVSVLKSSSPEYESLPEEEAIRELRDPRLRERLRPVFETDFFRTSWDLVLPNGTEVELALDKEEIRRDQEVIPISELELELKRGLPQSLYELALQIADSIDVRLENISKADSGYSLVKPREYKPVKAERIKLKPDMSIEEALSAILWNCLRQVQANEQVVLHGDDVEGVHQMRVGLRRFRSCLALFRRYLPKSATTVLRNDLRRLTAPLGPARDWDVFLNEHVRPMMDGLPNQHPLQGLRALTEQRRLEHHSHLHVRMRSREEHLATLRIASWIATRQWRRSTKPEARQVLDKPVGNAAVRILSRGHKRIRKYGKDLALLEEEQLHQLRIDVKKQRYAVEFFGSSSRKKARRYLKALHELQDLLGHLNDAVTARTLLEELSSFEASKDMQVFVEGWYARSRMEQRAQLPSAWKDFRQTNRFW